MKPVISDAELELRAELAAFSDPLLDKFRVDIRSMRTSEIILFAAQPRTLAEYLEFTGNPAEIELMSALTITVIDEIDRRIPIPEIP